ncbi:tRNA (adenosine(37)-N6)-threonylcarbamoyltransferase complex transferase subunit TsaD, partial [bacterium]|nr:tRNA (adenosine(37)-N6)-threonylcarbamoyltransferase complex transferase subunit TsaD [bacterium]
ANGALRKACEAAAARTRRRFVVPRLSYCGDNAAMIAFAGRVHLDRGERSDLSLDADPRAPLGDGPNRAPRRKKR